MLGQGKPKESIGSQLHLGRHPALGGGGVLERTTHCCVALTQGTEGEEHCFEGGKAWLTSHFEGLECFHQMMRAISSRPDSAWPGLEEIHIETLAIRESLSFYVS